MRKRIVFFIPSSCGGAERQAIVISKCLSNEAFEVVYHLFGPDNQLEQFLPADRKCVYHKEPRFNHNLISHMRKVIREEKPDVVYGTMMPVNWRLVVASFFTKCRVVLRNDNYLYTQNFTQKLRLALTYPFAHYIIAQTDEMRDGLIKGLHLSRKLVHTVPNAIDKAYIDKCLQAPSPYDELGKVRFVAVGRFHHDKGFDLLVKAFKLVKEQMPQAELYIVGKYREDNPVYVAVKRYVDDNQLTASVHFTGFQTNPYVYMAHAHCFVLSSRNEGLPNVMIEALHVGTPVAAMKCIPVIERIVSEGNTGYLAEKNNVEELARAMLKASALGRVKTSYNENNETRFAELFSTM